MAISKSDLYFYIDYIQCVVQRGSDACFLYVTASSPALSMREIEPELRAISNPYLLGVHLEIPTEDLELFRANHPNNFIQQRTDVINYWLQNSKNISWDALARAVERMRGHRNLVSRLRKLATGGATQESEGFSHASFNYCMLSNFFHG